jgi:hypothetical protein
MSTARYSAQRSSVESFDFLSLSALAGAGIMSGLIAAIANQPFAAAGAVFSFTMLGIFCYVQFARPALTRRKLRKPCGMYFNVTSSDRRILEYVSQDAREHLLQELVVPGRSKLVLEILFKPKLHFQIDELIIGFDGTGDRQKWPKIEKFLNRFIVRGKRQESTPETNENHYIDHHLHYHIKEPHSFTVGTDHTVGFAIETRDAGSYSVIAMFSGGEVEGFLRLPFRVENAPHSKMKCVTAGHKNCEIVAQSLPSNGSSN